MNRDKKKFVNFKRKELDYITYGHNKKGKILGTGDIGGIDTLEILLE